MNSLVAIDPGASTTYTGPLGGEDAFCRRLTAGRDDRNPIHVRRMTAVTGIRLGAAAAVLAARALGLAAWLAAASSADAQTPSEPPGRADAARLMNELMTGRVAVGMPFSLPNQDGRRVGPGQWRGQVVVLYFGYTYCPDACP